MKRPWEEPENTAEFINNKVHILIFKYNSFLYEKEILKNEILKTLSEVCNTLTKWWFWLASITTYFPPLPLSSLSFGGVWCLRALRTFVAFADPISADRCHVKTFAWRRPACAIDFSMLAQRLALLRLIDSSSSPAVHRWLLMPTLFSDTLIGSFTALLFLPSPLRLAVIPSTQAELFSRGLNASTKTWEDEILPTSLKIAGTLGLFSREHVYALRSKAHLLG